uniref:Uncharacterized protein n=1 Tax=Arundo donax TaxID=35708 RepID=A0A0A9CPH0_ARUDO
MANLFAAQSTPRRNGLPPVTSTSVVSNFFLLLLPCS